MALDGETLFAFEVHIIEHLSLHFALIERVGIFEQAVGQRTFAVVNMRDNTEVANIFHIYNIFILRANIHKIFYILYKYPNIVKKRHWLLRPAKLAIGPAVWSFGLYS